MDVIVSRAKVKNQKIYHKCGCIYEKRINHKNIIQIDPIYPETSEYRPCKYCYGLAGDVRVLRDRISGWENKYNMQITYQKNIDTLYVQTEIGFWKIFLKKEFGKYLLYHRNVFNKSMSYKEATYGDFHRQVDVKPQEELAKLFKYISDHDRAKVIIMDDYRKLPKSSKQQKKYYRQAKNREARQSRRRVDKLFAMLENQHPEYKRMAMM